jgi:hypothetical protein
MSVRTQIFDFQGAQGQRLSGRLDLPEGAATEFLPHVKQWASTA